MVIITITQYIAIICGECVGERERVMMEPIEDKRAKTAVELEQAMQLTPQSMNLLLFGHHRILFPAHGFN